MLPIRPICNRKKVRRDGTSLIQIQYCYSSEKKTLLNTGIAIPAGFWTKKSLCISDKLPPSYGIAKDLNTELKRMIRIAEDIVDFAMTNNISDPVEFAKRTFKTNFDASSVKKAIEKGPLKISN